MSQTAYDNWIFEQQEPGLVVKGNSKQFAPINNVMSNMRKWDIYRSEYIAAHGQRAWDELNKPVKTNLDNETL